MSEQRMLTVYPVDTHGSHYIFALQVIFNLISLAAGHIRASESEISPVMDIDLKLGSCGA